MALLFFGAACTNPRNMAIILSESKDNAHNILNYGNNEQ